MMILLAFAASFSFGAELKPSLTNALFELIDSTTPCPDAYQPTFEAALNLGREQWLQQCAAGKTGYDILSQNHLAYWLDCVKTFSPAVGQGLISRDKIESMCLDGRAGEQHLLDRFGGRPPAPSSGTFLMTDRELSELGIPTRPPSPDDLPMIDEPFASYLKLIVRYADPRDSWMAINALRTKPKLQYLDGERSGHALGAFFSGEPPKENTIILMPGFVLLPGKDRQFPLVAGLYKSTTPPLAVTRPSSGTRVADDPLSRRYDDGSVRVEYTSYEIAAAFLHELSHLSRRLAGGGANTFTDERDARDAELRFSTRLQQKLGRQRIFHKAILDELGKWQSDPDASEGEHIDFYRQEGLMRGEDVSISGALLQETDARRRIRLEADAREIYLTEAYQKHWRALLEKEVKDNYDRWIAKAQRAYETDRSSTSLAELEDASKAEQIVLRHPWWFLGDIDPDRF